MCELLRNVSWSWLFLTDVRVTVQNNALTVHLKGRSKHQPSSNVTWETEAGPQKVFCVHDCVSLRQEEARGHSNI